MRSKNKRKQTSPQSDHVDKVAESDCAVCNIRGPSEVHEPEQGMWWLSIPLCPACHRGPHGWHGDRLRWSLNKMTELKAINQTLERLYG